jgi:hypothetical protein
VQVKQVGDEKTGSDAVIRLERASPQNPDILVQWVDQDAFGEVSATTLKYSLCEYPLSSTWCSENTNIK